MLRKKVILILCLFQFIQLSSQTNEYIFEQISSDAGITFNALSSIIEDKYGFVWFGSNNGLYYYNNSEIHRYNFDPQEENSIPSDRINHLFKDSLGRIWVCTNNGIAYFVESENAFLRIPLREKGEYLENPSIQSILQVYENEFLVLYSGMLYQFDTNDHELTQIIPDTLTEYITYLGRLDNNEICIGSSDGKFYLSEGTSLDFTLFYNSSAGPITTIKRFNKNYWLGFQLDGVSVIDQTGNLISRYSEDETGMHKIPNDQIREIIQRKNGEVWIGTTEGISIVTNETRLLLRPDSYNGLPHQGVFDVYLDKNDGVWVGTWAGGLAYFSEFNYKFPSVRQNSMNERKGRSVISSFTETSDGLIWVGSENMGLSLYDPVKRTILGSNKTGTLPISRIKSIASDQDGNHWFGTYREGLWQMKDNSFSRIGDISGIFSTLCVVNNGVWIGDREGGLAFYNKITNEIKLYTGSTSRIGALSSNQVWDVFQDSRENIWVCTDFGLSVKGPDSEDFERYFYNESSSSISRNLNYTITEDKSGKLWIGTGGAGIDIYDPHSGLFSKFRLNSSIENADVYSILMDQDDNIWFSTNQGIYAYYPQTNTLSQFTKNDGLIGNQYHPNSGFVSSSGELYFGGGNGFNVIDPGAVNQNQLVPEVYLSKLLINNKPFSELESLTVNTKFINGVERLELKHNQNSITLGFVSNSFIKKDKNRYRFRITDYQDDWQEIAQGADVSFSKIPPGEYVLEVLAANNDGLWNEVPRKIQITIKPPFWQTWYAFLFYTGVFILSLYFIIKAQKYRAKTQADEALFSEKVKFFTNVSHEFRTPLTLIISPIDQLKKKFSNDPALSDQLKIIKRNADRLLRLTNQLLDFRLIELNKSKIKAKRTDLVSLCRNVYDCFEFQVIEKEINCIFNSEFKTFFLTVDEEKIDKIVYNLLSNALKYSPDKGQIILSLEQTNLNQNSYSDIFYSGNKFIGESLEIMIKDNGKGIKQESIPHVFDRFFADPDNKTTGTGIGLHICQEYVRLHNGNIMIKSELNHGTSFIVNIPIESKIESEKESIIIQANFDPLPEYEETAGEHEKDVQKGEIILFAEDNDEMRVYTKKTLSTRYKTLTAKNGQQAFEIAKEVLPDLIISDILMPGMDGLELTENIRETPETNHIPIILLTALSDDQHKIDSMTKGANSFLTKPVDASFLLAKIDNIFKEREALKKKYADQAQQSVIYYSGNESFIQKAEQIVEANLQNPSFEISEFAHQLSVSKSSLQRKMKAAINLNPSEFIRDFRLKKALELIKQGSLNIDEIAIIVGFNSTSYFIRTFKSKYGKTPAAYKAEHTLPKDE